MIRRKKIPEWNSSWIEIGFGAKQTQKLDMPPRNIMPLLWQQTSPQQCRPLDRGVPRGRSSDFMPCVSLCTCLCIDQCPVGQQIAEEVISIQLTLADAKILFTDVCHDNIHYLNTNKKLEKC